MKILQITPHFLPYYSGISKYVYNLSLKLSEFDNKITILTSTSYPNQKSIEYINKNIKIYRFNPIFNLKDPIIPSFLKKFFKTKFDIIHIHGLLFFTTYMSSLFQKFSKSKSVLTVHGIPGNSIFGKKLLLLRIFIDSIINNININRFIALTNYDYNKLIQFGYKPKKIRIIPNAINLNEFNYNFQNNNKENLILFVGRFEEQKGIRYLLKSVPLILDEIKCNLWLIGDGPEKRSIYNLINKLNIKNNVKIFSNVSDNFLLNAYGKSNVIILPSLWEGLSTVALESMAMSKPIIASKIPSFEEVIFNNFNGFLVDIKDPNQIADKTIQILKNKQLQIKLGKNGFNLVQKKYNWNKVIYKILKLYQELI
ncbi:MAG: glycosyltransferase family 4 protein [Candidatus Helarchaeota archaeon]